MAMKYYVNEEREPIDYNKAKEMLNGRSCIRLRKMVQLIRHYNNTISIRLYNTDIIVLNPDNSFQLYTGDWPTHTTKTFMNKHIPMGHVYSEGKNFFFGFPSKYIFQEGMTVYSDGSTNARLYRYDLFEKIFQIPINSDKDILSFTSKISEDELYNLWKKSRNYDFRNYLVIYLPIIFIPLILPTARRNEPWYKIAMERLQNTGS